MAERRYVCYSLEEGIAILLWDNPPLNVLCRALVEELAQVLEELEGDERVQVIIVTGAGERAFSAGADVKELLSLPDAEAGRQFAELGKRVCDRIEAFPKPIIAAIHGICVGGGAEIAEACAIRIAAENAQIGQPEIRLGIIPGWGGTLRLPRLIGLGKAMELILTGEMVSAEEALRLGWVNYVVPRDRLMEEAKALARKIADKSPLALRLSLQAIRDGNRLPYADGMKRESELFGQAVASEDGKEGIRAFLEKRTPVWKAR